MLLGILGALGLAALLTFVASTPEGIIIFIALATFLMVTVINDRRQKYVSEPAVWVKALSAQAEPMGWAMLASAFAIGVSAWLGAPIATHNILAWGEALLLGLILLFARWGVYDTPRSP